VQSQIGPMFHETAMPASIPGWCPRASADCSMPTGCTALTTSTSLAVDNSTVSSCPSRGPAMWSRRCGFITVLDGEIDACGAALRKAGADHRYVPTLMTAPGIGWVLGFTIAAEIGDITRFPKYIVASIAPLENLRHGGSRYRGPKVSAHPDHSWCRTLNEQAAGVTVHREPVNFTVTTLPSPEKAPEARSFGGGFSEVDLTRDEHGRLHARLLDVV
jgi:hypothetical protein